MVCRVLEVVRLGVVQYAEAMRVQRFYVDRLKSRPGSAQALLLCEHKPVYTVGIRTGLYPDQDLDRLRALGAEVHRSDRGGLITFHGPGQLVCYPIIHLGLARQSVRSYVSLLEKTVISVCSNFGIRASTSPHTGVWVGDNKICAIGIRCSRYVTSHGLALNVSPDLSWFRHIVPCGLQNKGVTSLSLELQSQVSVDQALPHVLQAFRETFHWDVLEGPDCEGSEPEGPHQNLFRFI